MKTIITIGGSLSKKSINKQLANYSARLIEDVMINEIDLNDYNLPLYNIDLEEEQGIPKEAKALYELIGSADGFIISLAEHNGAYTAGFKNIFDWLSRVNVGVFQSKPLLLMSTSPGPRGGQGVLDIAKDRFPRHAANITGTFMFPSFHDNFKNETIVNPDLKEGLLKEIFAFKQEVFK